MSSTPKHGAVLFAKDLPRMAAFYAGLSPMTTVVSEIDHIVLASETFELVLHAMPADIADSIVVASPPTRRVDVPVKLLFPVASLSEARGRAEALGGMLDPVAHEWAWRGMRVCDGHDPEGNVVQFREAQHA